MPRDLVDIEEYIREYLEQFNTPEAVMYAAESLSLDVVGIADMVIQNDKENE